MKTAFFTALLALVILNTSLFGQALSGTVVGTVTDQSDAAIPGATVTLTNEGTGFSRTVETNQSGQYAATSFPPGKIRLEVQVPGFQKLIREGVQLTAADIVTVNLQLKVGNVTETVEVTADAPLLQSQTAAVTSLVSNEQILDIPLKTRTFTSLLTIMPGAAAAQIGPFGNMEPWGFGYVIRSNTFISVNGSQSGNNSYLVDGMYNKGLWWNTLVMVPTPDSIQEMRVMASNYSAEYGDAAGAVTVAQSKSGTNQFHGSLYEFLHNDKLDANSFFNNRNHTPKSAYRRNEFGGTIGGPIRKDKTFFFGDYQGIRYTSPTTSNITIPTAAQKNMFLTGDFSGLGVQIYDPNNVVSGLRQPFTNNQIPINRIDPIAVKLINLLPDPNVAGQSYNYTFSTVSTQRTDQFDVRVDQNIGASDRLFVKFSYDNTLSKSPGSIPSPSDAGIPIGPFVTGGSDSSILNWVAAINFTKVIGSKIVNESRVGAVRQNITLMPTGTPYNTAAALGMPGINISDNAGGLPGFTIAGGFSTIGDASTFPEFTHAVSYQFENTTSILKGNHAIKFGARIVRHDFNGYSAFPTRSNWDFNGQYTSQIGQRSVTLGLTDFALGAPDFINRGYFPGVFGMRFTMFAGFVEDSWRVTNRLTFNLGLRYEIQGSPYEVNDKWSNFDLVTGKLRLAGRDGNSRSVRNNDLNNFGPRVGIAYQFNPKTVLRTGFGISYTEMFDAGTQLYKNLPYMVSQRITTDPNGAPVRYIRQGLPMPEMLSPTDPAINGGNPMAYPMNFQIPKVMQWSFGIQRELLRDVMLETSYVGSRGINIMAKVNTNQPTPGPGDWGPRRPLYSVNPLVGDLIYHDNWGASKYHSLQVRFQTRALHGLTAGLSYTYSHSLGNTGENAFANTAQYARNLAAEWGNTNTDRRHIVTINHLYQLPFGKGRTYLSKGVLGHIAGNWDISGVWSMMTGPWFTPRNPYNVSNANDTCNGCANERPDRIRDGNLPKDQRTIDHWFDTSAFQIQPMFTFGNAGNGILEGPGFFGFDAGIHRIFPIKEKLKAEFRWEMYNAFNRANFAAPISTIGLGPISGAIIFTQPPRTMQFALKFLF